jgi:WD40 repeat protein
VTCVQFNYDGSYVATGDMSGVVQVWKIASKLKVWETHVGDLTVSLLNRKTALLLTLQLSCIRGSNFLMAPSHFIYFKKCNSLSN